ncbi:hypothetical protein [Pannonibacter sp. SL95]|uniref:hypothetical protein n=1 Tax=Pannonibacter sp. SL95 TaxID=2995153 RepID=UPI002276AC9D|nr:hypothetical protein [Pannonibacter sp. SL95]MCY1708786.1 hypothetical protein [Pannonibacter sp. SL95]
MSRLLTLTPRYAGIYLTAINLMLVGWLVGLDPRAVSDVAHTIVPSVVGQETLQLSASRLIPFSELCPPCTRLVRDVIAFDRQITADAQTYMTSLLFTAQADTEQADTAQADPEQAEALVQ